MVSASNRKIIYKNLIINRKIGEGGFADVFRGLYEEGDVAIKILKLKNEEGESKEESLDAFSEFRREVWIMSSLQHPCLCGLVGFCIYPTCIVCEFVDKGDLYSFVHRGVDDEKYVEYGVLMRMM